MTNKELIATIRNEIERLKSIEYPCDNSQQATGFFNALDRMTDFLDTLESEKPSDKEPEVDLNGKVTFDNKTILRVETDEKKKRVLEIIGLEESCCNYPLNYENETDDCYYEEYNDRIYIDGNITFNQMREIVEYIENK